MKLAIVGSGALALFCAQHFDQLGAEVVLFQKNALGGNIRFLLDHFPEMEMPVKNKNKTLAEFWETDLVPLITLLEERQLTKVGEVLRVHKRFLHPTETIAGRSRLHDLFRVVYSVNPQNAILQQVEENPEMFKKLGEQVLTSLYKPVESFEDFDIVIEARGRGRQALPMGPSNAYALNENNLRGSAPLFYEKDIFTKLNLEDKSHLVLVGDNESAILTLLKCKDWIFSDAHHSLSWITRSSQNISRSNTWLNDQLIQLLAFAQAYFDQEKIEFEKKVRAWHDLEDYVKVKIPKPMEPQIKIKIFEGYNVTAIDRLLDREGLFATIESPDFREHALLANDLRTFSAEAIMIACGVEDEREFAKGINLDEPGYYRLDALDLNEGLSMIHSIEEKILAFFSRVQ